MTSSTSGSSSCRFIGGPYEGNYFPVLDSEDTYFFRSSSHSYSVEHAYARISQDEFIYTGSIKDVFSGTSNSV